MTLPDPQPGLVISFSYLWRREHLAGRDEGTKDRPCAIVLTRRDRDGDLTVIVAPLTHSPPRDPETAVEMPAAVKQHLGLDAERSWIACDEVNEFVWPGYDLRPVPGRTDHYDYGLLPPRLFTKVVQRIAELRRTRQGAAVPRT
jgi:mRNA-degrading endonuclease toxin of MazEF toxin-antitoxin module